MSKSPFFLLILLNYYCFYFIETDNGNLYVCNKKETLYIDNINRIVNEKYENKKEGLCLFPQIKNVDGITLKRLDLHKSNKIFFENIFLDNRGGLCFHNENREFRLGFSIFDVIQEPKIINRTIFTASMNTHIHTFSYNYEDLHEYRNIVVFIMSITLYINDTIYKKELNYNYIYSIFQREDTSLFIKRNKIFLNNVQYDIRTVEGEIVNVYDLKPKDNKFYFENIHRSVSLTIYKNKPKPNEFKGLIIIITIFSITKISLLYRNKYKKDILKITEKIARKNGFLIQKGIFDKSKVMVKTYQLSDSRVDREVFILKNYYRSGMIKFFYKENRNKLTHLVFEDYRDLNRRLTKSEIFIIIKTVNFLHKNQIAHGDICLDNIKINKDGNVILSNFSTSEILNVPVDEEILSSKNKIEIINKKTSENNENEDFMIETTSKRSFNGIPDVKERKIEPYRERGTIGWRSPEVILSNNKLFELTEQSKYKADVFSLSILLYYNFFNRSPFGNNPRDIEENILRNKYNLEYMEDHSLHDLICNSMKNNYFERLTINKVYNHPYFWTAIKKFNFLADISDFIEYQNENGKRIYLRLERNKKKVFLDKWNTYIDDAFEEEILNFKFYKFNNLRALLRVIRNKGRHFTEIPDNIKEMFGTFPEGYVNYFEKLFPSLIMVCYYSASCCSDLSQFKIYYDLESARQSN